MKRKVVGVENYIYSYATGTKGSNWLTLECGHVKRQKGNVRVPQFCRCVECDDDIDTREVRRPTLTRKRKQRIRRISFD